MTLEERLVQVCPSERQLAHQQLEFYAFVHFTVNTFTNKEWGDGTEKPEIFNPHKLDAEQWVKAVKSAGMKGLILTCKHHDGFCLWPSKYTEHSVKNSPYKQGNGDIVAETAAACKKHGIKFGVYLSPWDRNNSLYGQGEAYDDFFCNQLTELLTGYGDIFSVWFDGACGEGPNGKKQIYNFDRYYEVIRNLQPNACISVCGPDVRWCGNEAGYCRPSEWSVVPLRTKDTEIIKEKSQQEDSPEFRQRKISAWDSDLGSRELLKNEEKLIWYPAEVNTSIRPGWFYHPNENDKVRTPEDLFNIYLNSVGGNATFLLNIPPTPEGLFHKKDVEVLEQFGTLLKTAFSKPIFELTKPQFQNTTNQFFNYTFTFPETNLSYLVLQEDITKSQRVENFSIMTRENNQLKEIFTGTVIGYKKIIRLQNAIKTNYIEVHINQCRTTPQLLFVGAYE